MLIDAITIGSRKEAQGVYRNKRLILQTLAARYQTTIIDAILNRSRCNTKNLGGLGASQFLFHCFIPFGVFQRFAKTTNSIQPTENKVNAQCSHDSRIIRITPLLILSYFFVLFANSKKGTKSKSDKWLICIAFIANSANPYTTRNYPPPPIGGT